MPTSDLYNVPWVSSIVTRIKPLRVLEIGVGIGIYGVTIRQILEIAPGRLTKNEWQGTLDGVEIFEPYRNPTWDYFYDKVMITDARSFVHDMPEYDVVLMADVIEHFTKEDGRHLVEAMLKRVRYIIITTPHSEYPQGTVHGNEAETHLSQWSTRDFSRCCCWSRRLRECLIIILAGQRGDLRELGLSGLPKLSHTNRNRRPTVANSRMWDNARRRWKAGERIRAFRTLCGLALTHPVWFVARAFSAVRRKSAGLGRRELERT